MATPKPPAIPFKTTVSDADGSPISLQGVQKVRAYQMPAGSIVALPDDGTTFSPTQMIIGNAAGTATVVDAQGNTIDNFPITGGEQHVSIVAITSLGTTTTVWGLY